MATNNGEPRRDATHSPGKWRDLNANAKAPSYSKQNRNDSIENRRFVNYIFVLNLPIVEWLAQPIPWTNTLDVVGVDGVWVGQ